MSVKKKYTELLIDVAAISALMKQCTDVEMLEELNFVSSILIFEALKTWPNKAPSTMNMDVKLAFDLIKERNAEILVHNLS